MKVFTHSSRRTHVWLPRLRHLFQLGAFVLLPGLFAEGFAAVGQRPSPYSWPSFP